MRRKASPESMKVQILLYHDVRRLSMENVPNNGAGNGKKETAGRRYAGEIA